MGAELSHHLGYAPGANKPENASNHRNGASGKTVLTEDGPLRIEVPRDREGSFEPLLMPKYDRRFTGFDDKIVALCARGMTVHEVQGFLAEQYGTEVAPDFISFVTDGVMAEVGAWQARPLEPMYPVLLRRAAGKELRRRRLRERPQRHACQVRHTIFGGWHGRHEGHVVLRAPPGLAATVRASP